MSIHSEKHPIRAYEIMEKRGFETGDIADLVEYLDRHQKETMQPFLDRIDARFDRIDAKFDRIDAKVEQVEERFNARFDQVDARFNQVEERVSARFDQVEERFDSKLALLQLKMVSRKQAWGMLGVLLATVVLVPEAFEQMLQVWHSILLPGRP